MFTVAHIWLLRKAIKTKKLRPTSAAQLQQSLVYADG